MLKLSKFDILKKIMVKEFSLEECINVLSNNECWVFPNTTDKKQVKGVLAIYILKFFLEFFPKNLTCEKEKEKENLNVKVEFENILKKMDKIIVSKILKELVVCEKSNINIVVEDVEWKNAPFSDNEFFNIFKNSATYIKLYNKVNYLFSTLNLNEEIKLTDEEKEILRQKVLNEKGHHESFLNHVKNELDKKLNDHIEDLIFYSQILNKFYCSIFTKNYNIKRKNMLLILPVFENEISKVNISNLFEICEKTEKFFLNLQNFMYKYKVDNIHLYLKRYKERSNFIKNIVFNIDERYPHLLSEIIEKMYPKFYNTTCNINSKNFFKSLTFKKLKFIEVFKNINNNLLTKLDDLILIFYIKTWFEKILDISRWSRDYLHLDIFDKNLLIKEINGGFYPIIINLFSTCWGVLYNGNLHIGNIIYVLFKYKNIIKRKFNLELKKSSQAIKRVSLKNFLIFKKKRII